MCESCIRREVCGRYIAASGDVKNCAHYYKKGSMETEGDVQDG